MHIVHGVNHGISPGIEHGIEGSGWRSRPHGVRVPELVLVQTLGASTLLRPVRIVVSAVVVVAVVISVQESTHGGMNPGLGGLPLLIFPGDAVWVGNAAGVAGWHLRRGEKKIRTIN